MVLIPEGSVCKDGSFLVFGTWTWGCAYHSLDDKGSSLCLDIY